MPRNPDYLTKLNTLIDLIQKNQFDGDGGALHIFSDYLDSIATMGSFHASVWNANWRKKIYEIGTLFSEGEKKDATKFIEIINGKEKNEAIDFIFSEIAWNRFDYGEYGFNIMKGFVQSYPNNPEFHHSLSHWYEGQGNYEKAREEARFALKIEPNNKTYLGNAFNKEKRWINNLIKNGKFEKAKSLLNNMMLLDLYKGDSAFNNILVALSERLQDHILIKSKIDGIEDIIENKSNKEKIKIIEIISFFTAIISFVIINVNIAVQITDFKKAIVYMTMMAGILMLFIVGISICLTSGKRPWKDRRVRFILIASALLVSLPYIIDKLIALVSTK